MGFAYIVQRGQVAVSQTTHTSLAQVCALIDSVSWLTYSFHREVGNGFMAWVTWVRDIAAYRKCRAPPSHDLAILEGMDAADDVPRDKSGGVLCMGIAVID